MPRLLVDVRHEAAHNELPSLSLLRQAATEALTWLKEYYWERQRLSLQASNFRITVLLSVVTHIPIPTGNSAQLSILERDTKVLDNITFSRQKLPLLEKAASLACILVPNLYFISLAVQELVEERRKALSKGFTHLEANSSEDESELAEGIPEAESRG